MIAETTHGSVEERAGDYVEAQERLHAALRIAERVHGHSSDKARVYSQLGNLAWKLGHVDQAIELLLEAIRLHQSRGDAITPLFERLSISAAHITAGRNELAFQEAAAGLEAATSYGHSYLIAALSANTAEACLNLDRFADAEHYAMLSLGQEEEGIRTYALAVLGRVRHGQGRHAEAMRLLEESAASAQEVDDPYAEAAAWRAHGDACASAGRTPQARASYSRALSIYAQLGLEHEGARVQAALAALGDDASNSTPAGDSTSQQPSSIRPTGGSPPSYGPC
jgi:tetratricopeptide (TPR) repeat protein